LHINANFFKTPYGVSKPLASLVVVGKHFFSKTAVPDFLSLMQAG
jgi:hypothetical protein